MVVTTTEGRYILEKNAVINMDKFLVLPEECDQMVVGLKTGEITMNGMLEITRKSMGDEKFFVYEAASNNCQDFIDCVLKSNMMSSSITEAFINQDSEFIFEESPHFELLVKDITDIGALADRKYQSLQELAKEKAEEIDMKIESKYPTCHWLLCY